MVAVRLCCQVLLLPLLAACAADSPSDGRAAAPVAAPAPVGPLDFGWRLSGDRGVAPLQVFSDARQTWLQWTPGQVMPAVIAAGPGGEQVLAYTRQDPYTIVEGHWPELVFRAGARQAVARRRGHMAARPAAPAVQPEASQRVDSVAPSPGAPQAHATAQAFAYAVTPEDGHLRQALARWTGLSGWRFQPEHWAVDIDVPISAGAAFGDDFVPAVQALVATTELSDRPLQPCFYSNQVLRVVAASEPCDRTVAPGEPT